MLARFLPDAVRTHLLSGLATAEHRTATVAFLQYCGLDEVIAHDGAQDAARRLDELVRLVQDAVARYDVCFLDSDIAADGGKIRLSAGVPRVVGDDEERMLLALRHIIEAGPPLPVRVGVHRGPVFTGPVGPDYRRWYAVMGDTVNLAARLGAKAPVGRIYATRDVLRRVNTRFEETALDPFAVKGKKRPVQAWDVGPPVRGATEAALRMELALVGRERELAQLRASLEGARRGSGTLIELVGETGSGKSRLLAEAEKLAGGMSLLRTTCEVYTRETPYAAAGDLLRQLLGLRWDDPEQVVLDRLETEIRSTAPDLEAWLALIAIVLNVETPPSKEVRQLAPEARVHKLHEVVVRFLGRRFVVPTLVEVEHVEHMDAASAALFGALGRELESSSWVVVLTRRGSGGLMLEGYEHVVLELDALSDGEIRRLARATSEAAELPPHVVELAAERSGGSPQFLLDLLAAAVAGDHDELPESVGAATMARIDALDPGDGAIVRRAAVLGTRSTRGGWAT